MSDNKKNKKIVSDKRAANLKLFSIGSVVILFLILLAVNIFLYVALDDKLSFDMSASSKYTLSKEAKEKINEIPSDKKVRIVGLFEEPESIESTPYEYIVPWLSKLEDEADGTIEVSYVDPTTHPGIITELDPNQTTDILSNIGAYAVYCDGKIRFIDPQYDCFGADEQILATYNYWYPSVNKVESAFINSIINVTSESQYKVYYLSDIQGTSHMFLDSVFASMNIDMEELSVNNANFVVPDDCDLLMILNPDVDIPENVQEAIKDYLWNAKPGEVSKLIVSLGLDTNNTNQDFTNINNVLNEMNLKVENNCIMDQEPSNIIDYESGKYKGVLTDNYKDLNTTGFAFYRLSRNVVLSGSRSDINCEPVVVSSDKAVLYDFVNSTKENEVAQSDVQANAAMYAYTEGLSHNVSVLVFGSDYFTSDEYFYSKSSNDENNQLIRSMLSKFFPTSNSASIPDKQMENFDIDASKVNQNTISTVSIIFLAFIPLAFVFMAWFVYYRRSHL